MTGSDFRCDFTKLKDLAGYPVQKIYLTATLPPHLEPQYMIASHLPSSTIIYRAPTPRPNLRYHVLKVDERLNPMKEVVISLARLLTTTTFSPKSRGIIYTVNIELTDSLATYFKNCKSHSDVGEKTQISNVGRWTNGDCQWIVATSGFLQGIDNPDVDAVIFADIPFGFINLQQGSGRAGRLGQIANVFLLTAHNTSWLLGAGHEVDVGCRIMCINWAKEEEICRRSDLGHVFDAIRSTCADIEGAVKCDNCDPHSQLLVSARQLLIAPPTPPAPPALPLPDIQEDGAQSDYGEGDWDDTSLLQVDESVFNNNETSLPSTSSSYPPTYPNTSNSVFQFTPPIISSPVLPKAVPGSSTTRKVLTMTEMSARAGQMIIPPQSTIPVPSAPFVPLSTFPSFSSGLPLQGPVIIPPTAAPSTGIMIDSQFNLQQRQLKTSKVVHLNTLLSLLKGKCYSCWALNNTLVNRSAGHHYFSSCTPSGKSTFVHSATGYMDVKKNMKFPDRSYGYCFYCTVPQGKHLPTPHPPMANCVRDKKCPFSDFIVVILWSIFLNPEILKRCIAAFPNTAFHTRMTNVQIGRWAAQETGPANFCNAVEVVLWFYKERREGRV